MTFKKFIRFFALVVRKCGYFLQKIAVTILNSTLSPMIDDRPKLVEKGDERSLYRTQHNHFFWLNNTGYVDKCIKETGVFEPESTAIVKRFVKEGNVVLDVGANIGYYSVIMSKLVGSNGKVLCFEPTKHFGKVLDMNLKVNENSNVEIFPFGLSNHKQRLDIQIGLSSASLHSSDNGAMGCKESIDLVTLDQFLAEHPLGKIDFIKIDVDGHEPLFLEGARETLEKNDPTILLEVSHPHYLRAGYTAWDFYDSLKNKNYHIYHEDGFIEINSKDEFLQKCGNFNQSANIVISKRSLL